MTDLGKADNIMDALFGLEMEEEFTCEESGESKISKSTAKKLVCNIQGGAGASTQARRKELERGDGRGGGGAQLVRHRPSGGTAVERVLVVGRGRRWKYAGVGDWDREVHKAVVYIDDLYVRCTDGPAVPAPPEIVDT